MQETYILLHSNLFHTQERSRSIYHKSSICTCTCPCTCTCMHDVRIHVYIDLYVYTCMYIYICYNLVVLDQSFCPCSMQKHAVDFYISDFQSGLRALVKTGYGARVTPYVDESLVIEVDPLNKELSPEFVRWLGERNLSSDDRVMQLKEGQLFFFFFFGPFPLDVKACLAQLKSDC